MKKNVGNPDRLIRILLALALVVWAWFAGMGSILGVVLLVLAVVLGVTASISFCPLYLPFGLSTRGHTKN